MMNPQAEKLAEVAERIERNLKRFDEIAIIAAQIAPVRERESAPHWLARVLAKLRRCLTPQPSAREEETRRFDEVERRLGALEKCGAAMAREAAQQAANAREWELNAKLAVRAGDDDLARYALYRKLEALHRAATLEQQAATISAAMAEYTSALAAIKACSR
ncbi:PspA/IM30 family protein [Sorangium sp. So ce1099]|uniref:PspA/IM30 family protein n=1 Tax=Sorangium sp. So ce1099 TaxID=3133331 RepID=UPI003F642BEA